MLALRYTTEMEATWWYEGADQPQQELYKNKALTAAIRHHYDWHMAR